MAKSMLSSAFSGPVRRTWHRLLLAALSLSAVLPAFTAQERVAGGLLALYEFKTTEGDLVKDTSGAGEPLNLRIADLRAVRRFHGSIEIQDNTVIRSEDRAAKIFRAVKRSGEITIEAWIHPANTKQEGPARIVTISRNPSERNFTLGQEKDRYDVRLRTTRTSGNGIPSVDTARNTAAAKLVHIVYTRDRSGRTRIYLDGTKRAEETVEGTPSNWDGSYRLGLANELTGNRPWQGSLHLVAIYGRELTPREVAANFRAGTDAVTADQVASAGLDPEEKLFHTEIAPLLAQHCFECHDAANRKGKLDLSHRAAAMKGSSSGTVIEPGDAAKSVLWQSVLSNEMPEDRPPLSDREKQLLKEWIDSGAKWPIDYIDPSIYSHPAEVAENWLRRLTIDEYIQTVRGAVGVDIEKVAREILPPDVRADGFSNTAYNLNVDFKHVEAYSRLAEIVVERMNVLKFAGRFSKSRKLIDKDNRDLIAKMGKWILRGPLKEHEIVSYRGISTATAAAAGNFKEATARILEAMLQSPRFLYRIENQRGDGSAWPVGEYELASRISYILWGAPPDRELIRAAEAGELFDREKVAAQVDRMLEDSRAIERSAQFISQWLNLGRLKNLRPNAGKFPGWDPKLADDMRRETLAFFREIAWEQNRPLADLLDAQITHVTPRLAKHYGLPPVESAQDASTPVRYDVSKIPGRGGLLTHGSVLTVGGDEASMVARGLFVLHEILRGEVKDPPPCVDTTPVPTKEGLTQRSIALERIANPSCGGCHGKFEPLAFGLEKFDGLGTFHNADEHGNKLRDDGGILFPGTAEPVAYRNSAELMKLLSGSDRVRETITWKLTQFALGRPLTALDAPEMQSLHKQAQKNGGTYQALIKAIVLSDLVQKIRTEAGE